MFRANIVKKRDIGIFINESLGGGMKSIIGGGGGYDKGGGGLDFPYPGLKFIFVLLRIS